MENNKNITLLDFLNQHPTFIENLESAGNFLLKHKQIVLGASMLRYNKELNEYYNNLGWTDPFK